MTSGSQDDAFKLELKKLIVAAPPGRFSPPPLRVCMPPIHIRGLGLVSSYGIGVACAVDGMRAGRTGITPLTLFSLPFQNQIQVNQFDHAPFPPGADCATATMKTAVQEALTEARVDA